MYSFIAYLRLVAVDHARFSLRRSRGGGRGGDSGGHGAVCVVISLGLQDDGQLANRKP